MGIIAGHLTPFIELAMGITVVAGAGVIWASVRSLMLQQLAEAERRADDALEQSRSFARVLMDNMPGSVFLKSRSHRYLAGNLQWAQLNNPGKYVAGDDLSGVLGHTDRELFDADRAERFERSDDTVFTTGERFAEYETDVLNGEERYYHVIKVPVRNPYGDITAVAGLGLDLTELHRVEQELRSSREQLRTFIDNALEHICIVDAQRRIVLANTQLLRFFGVKSSDLVGRDLLSLVAPEEKEKALEFVRLVLSGVGSGLDVFHVRSARGTVHLTEVSAGPIMEGGTVKSVVLVGRVHPEPWSPPQDSNGSEK
ncbi:MAG: PAS domain S-box protein [Caldisericota bacterium]|nr:PAS domain S-box protein [Caldisericota bacterium]